MIIRLVGGGPDQNEWLVGHRYLAQHSADAILTDYEEDNNRKEAAELAAA